jgi:hypothetical protein
MPLTRQERPEWDSPFFALALATPGFFDMERSLKERNSRSDSINWTKKRT